MRCVLLHVTPIPTSCVMQDVRLLLNFSHFTFSMAAWLLGGPGEMGPPTRTAGDTSSPGRACPFSFYGAIVPQVDHTTWCNYHLPKNVLSGPGRFQLACSFR